MENSQLRPIATHAQSVPPAQISPVLDSTQGGVFFAEPRSQDANRRKPSRKQTIIALLDEFAALREEEYKDDNGVGSVDGQGGQVTVGERERIKNQQFAIDDRLANEGAQMFWSFNKLIGQVDTELQNFGNAVRPLGSSVGLIASSFHLRVRLQHIRHLFRENAANTFKDKVPSDPPEPLLPFSSRKKSKARNQRPTRTLRPAARMEADLETFPHELEMLATDLKSFLHFLHDIPEFTDEGLNSVVLSFEADLKYWASCLKDFKGQFRFHSVGRYVNDLTKEMDEHLKEIKEALKIFQNVGVTTIRFSQGHTATGLQNLSTVATFFSGVTATTIQYSFDKTDDSLQTAVNALWITSLVFSIASSINSQLAYHWRAAMYRSPRNAVPWWVSIWLTRTPLIFLVVSVMAFSAGLVCFTFSQQKWIVQVLATIFTSVTSSALLAVALWFAGEKWVYSTTKGSKWLTDVLGEMKKEFYRSTGLTWAATGLTYVTKATNWGGTKLTRVSTGMSRVFEKVSPSRKRSGSGSTTGSGSGTSGAGAEGQEEYNLGEASGGHLPMPVSTSGHGRSRSYSEQTKGRPSTPVGTIFEDRLMTSTPVQEYPGGSSAPVISSAKARFQKAVKKAIQSQHLGFPSPLSNPQSPRQTRQQSVVVSVSDHTRGESTELYATRPPRFMILQPALKKLITTQYLEQHSALVRHLQFSPDGKYLATASWDRTVILWKVGDPFQMHEKLLHLAGFVNQVAWSPDGKHLLTRAAKQIKIWTNTGLCMRTINRQHKVQALTWMPSGKSFLCVEHSNVHILDMAGKELETHPIDRIKIHDVGVTLDEHRLVIVGRLEQSKDSLKPSKSRAEKRIIVYDLKDRDIENQAPVLENIQDVTISRDGAHALVSYEDTAYPELWSINLIKGEGRLNLQNTYITPSPVHFAGPSYFGGLNDQFVICAGKAGDIYVWDKETAMLLHCIQASQPGEGDESGDLTAIGWNHCSPGKFMFASATHDGTVRIWTAPAPPETAPSSRAGSPEPFSHRGRGMTGTSLSTTIES